MMKKYLFLILMTFVAFQIRSQSFSAGLRGGVQFSEYTHVEDARGVGMLYHAGVYGSFDLNEKYAIQAEALLSRQGRNQKGGGYRERAMYINVPLMFKYRWTSNLSILAGGQLGLLQNAKILPEQENGETEPSDVTDQYKAVNVAAIIGADLDINDRWALGFRTTWGKSSFHKEMDRSRQYVFQITGTYRLFSL